MNTTVLVQAFENIRESSLLFTKLDLALIAGLSTLDYFQGMDATEVSSTLAEFSFVLGYLLALIAVGVVIEFSAIIMKNKISLVSNIDEGGDLKLELKLTKWAYGIQVFGHIGLLGFLHGYLVALVG